MKYSEELKPQVGDILDFGGKEARITSVTSAYGGSNCQILCLGGDGGIGSYSRTVTWNELIGMEYERPRTPLSVAERWTALCEGKVILTSAGYPLAFDQESDRFRWNRGVSAGLESLRKVDDPNETWYLVEDA